MTGYQPFMSDIAVLVVDMLNAYRHEDAELLAPNVAGIIDPLVGIISCARERDDVDLIYVNDNYGDFTADHDDIVSSALEGEHPELVKPIVPPDGCMFLEKVRHSAFYSTALGYLHPPFLPCRAARRGRAHRRRSGQGGAADDGAKYARRAHFRGKVPRLTR